MAGRGTGVSLLECLRDPEGFSSSGLPIHRRMSMVAVKRPSTYQRKGFCLIRGSVFGPSIGWS